MTTIQISESFPIRRTETNDTAYASGITRGGAYSFYARSTASFERRATSRTRRGSLGGKSRRSGYGDAEDEDAGLRREDDFKTKQVFSGRHLAWLAYQSIGVIYGDIGTSPLYVYSSTFTSDPSYQDLVGVLSIVIWSLVMMVTVKYVLIILRMDNEGEGGTFSTYSLLSRYANITNRDPREASLIRMERYDTGDLSRPGEAVRHGIEGSRFAQGLLKTIGVLAVSMVMSDGMLTPAQSVLGAVQGIQVVSPSISTATIVGTTCGILILLFVIQPLGTTKIASTFAPIVIIWLGFNAAFGIFNLVKHDWTVLKAFNPAYGFEYLIRHKTEGWRSLGGILLAFTGVEALFADLGAFSRRAIQISWLGYTLPCLLLAYIGQAAYISDIPSAYSNPFFNAAPPGTLYPSLIIAILAAVVASQAIITATFQLLAQIMKLSYFPQIKVVHTSKIFYGQLYVPLVNWTLMVGTILIAAVYNNTTSLGNAYGVCVMFVTFFDTCMVTLAAIIVKRINPFYVVLPWLTIACMDGAFLSSALTKVPNGAWFTLTLAGVLASAFILWRYGKEQQWSAEAKDRFNTSKLVQRLPGGQVALTPAYGGEKVDSIKGLGVFFDKAGEYTPMVFTQFLSKLAAAPEVMIFFHLRPLETPTVSAEKRYSVSRLGLPNCYRLVVRHGYMDEVITPNLAAMIYGQVREYIIRDGNPPKPQPGTMEAANGTLGDDSIQSPIYHTPMATPDAEKTPAEAEVGASTHATDEKEKQPMSEKMTAELEKLEQAYLHQVLYIVGKNQMKVKSGTKLWRRFLLSTFLWLRDNTRSKIANLKVPTDRLMEIGFVKEV